MKRWLMVDFSTNLESIKSQEILGDILASTTGMNSGCIKWQAILTFLFQSIANVIMRYLHW